MPRKKTNVEVTQETLETEELTQESSDNVIPLNPQSASYVPVPSPYEQRVKDIAEKLNKPVPDSLILKREGGGGRSFDYIQGQDAIRLANDIFGWANWSHSVKEVKFQPINGGKPLVTAQVCVSALGSFHEDVGFAAIQGNPDNEQNVETAIKGAVTDGVKRALRYFGEALGNSLYPDAETKAADDAARQQARNNYAPKPVQSANPNPPAPKPAAAPQGGVVCEDCGGPVTTFGSLTMEQLINIRQRKFGATICSTCSRKPEWVAVAKDRAAN
jgi:DNA recombination protein Rad52